MSDACRWATLQEGEYHTLVIESSFVAIERSIEARLLERSWIGPAELPGSHTGIYDEAATAGIVSESIAHDLADLWREHRAKTYYQDGLATEDRADRMHALATEIHEYIVGRSRIGHECVCNG